MYFADNDDNKVIAVDAEPYPNSVICGDKSLLDLYGYINSLVTETALMNSMHSRCLEFIGSKAQELILEGVSVYLSNKTSINNKYGGTFFLMTKCLKWLWDQAMIVFSHLFMSILIFAV